MQRLAHTLDIMKWEERFTHRIHKLEQRIAIVQQQQDLVFNIRLGIALVIFALLVTAVLFPKIGLEIPVLVLGFIFFAYFVIRSNKLKIYQTKLGHLSSFYQRSRARIRNSDSDLEYLNNQAWLTNTPKLDEESAQLSRDLDLFGSHSIWSNISEVFSEKGVSHLQSSLLYPNLNLQKIIEKQKKVALAKDYDGFLRKFVVLGFLGHNELTDIPTLESEIQKTSYDNKNEKIFWFVVALWFCALIELLVAVFAPKLSFGVVFRLIFPLVSLISIRSLGDTYSRSMTLSALFTRLKPIFEHLNKLDSKSKAILLPQLTQSNPVQNIIDFDKCLSFLTVNSHPLIVLVMNVLLPWNYFFTRRLEIIRKKLAQSLPNVIDEMGDLEEIASFSFILKYRPTHFATFSSTPSSTPKPKMSACNLKHPINDSHFVDNSFAFENERLVLLTGSNMSGKSTFMRTLGVNHILALAGAPVFAISFETFVAPLYSCIRVSDSLRDGASYFYAEVKRLKFILDKSKGPQPILYLVDEIFKGTNNRERFLGSRELILFLSQTRSLGLISTHDLELAVLENENIKNWHFSDSIEDGRLNFSYKLKKGPSPSTNALKIMQMEGLPTPKNS